MRHAVVFVTALLLRADPSTPVFATYLGGAGNEVVGSVTTDSAGNIYITGRTDSPDFPLKNPIQAGAKSFSQIFIAKFSPTGDLLFSTYYGGSANDLATGIALDPAGNVYVTGTLQSLDFPVVNAVQQKSAGGSDAFVLKLDPAFHVVYATYLGGSANDLGMAIATDALGNAYVTGETSSTDFPVTAGAFQTSAPGHTPYGFVYPNAFVTKLDASGNMIYSTYLGGSGGSIGWGIAVDATGDAHVAGETGSNDFPIAGNALQSWPGRPVLLGIATPDAFLSKLTADGSGLVYSTLLGGPMFDTARSVTLDANGNAFITGITSDARLPIVGGGQAYLAGDVYLVSADGGVSYQAQRTGLAAAQTTGIVFDPNVQSSIYAATMQGVFHSPDGGATWTAAGLDRYWIRSLALDPANPGTWYAGTYFGGGIFRTTDGGDTWMGLNSGFPNAATSTFDAIAVDRSGSGTVYAVAGNSGTSNGDQPIYQITNDGAMWTTIGQGLPSTPQAINVNPADGMLYAGTARIIPFGGGFGPPPPIIAGSVYRFDTNTWVNGGLDDDIHALAFSGNTLYAAGQKFYRSTDGGETWASTVLPDNGNALQIAIGPGNPATIYLLSGSPSPLHLLRSDDGGDSFVKIDTPPLTTIAVNPIDAALHAGTTASADAYVAQFAPDGTLLFSTFIGTPTAERGEGIALDASGSPYIVGITGPGLTDPSIPNALTTPYVGNTFVASGDGSYWATIGPTTSQTVLDMPSHGITIGPDGSIIAVMIATAPGLVTTPNAVQNYLNGASDVYLVKWSR